MRKASFSVVGFAVFLLLPAAHSQPVQSINTNERAARVAFVKEFIREVEALYQQTAQKELAEDSSPNGKLATAIRGGTRIIYETNGRTGGWAHARAHQGWLGGREATRREAGCHWSVARPEASRRGEGPRPATRPRHPRTAAARALHACHRHRTAQAQGGDAEGRHVAPPKLVTRIVQRLGGAS
jgi:hypothetical protein